MFSSPVAIGSNQTVRFTEKRERTTTKTDVSSVDEEHSGAGQRGQGVGHLADSGVVDESSQEEQKAWRAAKEKGELLKEGYYSLLQ